MLKILLMIFISINILNAKALSKKEAFLEKILPIINEVYNEKQFNYLNAKSDIEHSVNLDRIEKLKKKFKSKTNEELLAKMKPHPISLTLAQSAIESDWRTSRFAKEANNLFGIWSFSKNDQRLQAGKTRDGKKIFVRRYDSYKDSIDHYYRLLSKGRYFKDFQKLKGETDNPFKLSEGLLMYSEKREVYVNSIKDRIKENDFTKYDR